MDFGIFSIYTNVISMYTERIAKAGEEKGTYLELEELEGIWNTLVEEKRGMSIGKKAIKKKGKGRVNGYLLFSNAKREELVKKNPDLKKDMKALSGEISEQWGKLKHSKKSEWNEKAKEQNEANQDPADRCVYVYGKGNKKGEQCNSHKTEEIDGEKYCKAHSKTKKASPSKASKGKPKGKGKAKVSEKEEEDDKFEDAEEANESDSDSESEESDDEDEASGEEKEKSDDEDEATEEEKSEEEVPAKSPTKAPVKAPAKSPTKAPAKSPVKAPAKSPTKAPAKAPAKSVKSK